MTRTTPQELQKWADKEYAVLSLLPKYYDPTKPENIVAFGVRLRQSRKDYYDRHMDVIGPSSSSDSADRQEVSQEFLAKYVGVSIMTISKYERGKIKKIPVKKLRRICEILDVTPHYLLGIVSDPCQSLGVDKNGIIIRVKKKKEVEDEQGNKKEIEVEMDEILTPPMQFDAPLCIKAVELYRTLFEEDSELYWLINDLVCSPTPLRNYYKRILASVLSREGIRQVDEEEKV